MALTTACLSSLKGLWNCYATCANVFAYVNVPSCVLVFCEALVPVHLSGVCIPLHFALFVPAPVPLHALIVLISLCCQQSSVVHMCVDPFCLLLGNSTFKHG